MKILLILLFVGIPLVFLVSFLISCWSSRPRHQLPLNFNKALLNILGRGTLGGEGKTMGAKKLRTLLELRFGCKFKQKAFLRRLDELKRSRKVQTFQLEMTGDNDGPCTVTVYHVPA